MRNLNQNTAFQSVTAPPTGTSGVRFLIGSGFDRPSSHVLRSQVVYLDPDPVFGIRDLLMFEWKIPANGTRSVTFGFLPNQDISKAIA